MKSILFATSILALSCAVGCGSASRTPAEYAEATSQAFGELESELKGCYEGVLAKNPGAQGDVTVKFYWNSPAGQDYRYPGDSIIFYAGDEDKLPAGVSVTSNSGPDELAKCVTDSAPKARIRPAGSGAGNATWTFKFSQGTATAEPAAETTEEAPAS